MNGTPIKKGEAWLYGYGITLLLHLAAITAGWSMVRFVTKPLLMALLLVYFLAAGPGTGAPRFLITLALVFSWLGDVFLMNDGTQYFTAGLASFLVAHLFYIIYFSVLRRKQLSRKPWNIILLIILGLYVGIFYFFLGPALEQPLKMPVFLYAIVIATMFAMAWHSSGSTAQAASLAKTGSKIATTTAPETATTATTATSTTTATETATTTTTSTPSTTSAPGIPGAASHPATTARLTTSAPWFITGAALFIISDSLLAVNAFLHPFNSASFWVMITYGLAQAGIILGAVGRKRLSNKEM